MRGRDVAQGPPLYWFSLDFELLNVPLGGS